MGNKQSNKNRQKSHSTPEANVEQGVPFNLVKNISIKVDQQGRLVGMPDEWKKYGFGHQVDNRRTVKSKNVPEIARATEIPDEILNLASMLSMTVSSPQEFTHVHHIEIDPTQPYGLKGLPEEWIERFKVQGLNTEEVSENPQNMLKIIQNYGQSIDVHLPQVMPTDTEFTDFVKSIEIKEEDPSKQYNFGEQLGKGAVCKVFKVTKRRTPQPETYAVRVMKLSDRDGLEKVKVEIALMVMCKHANIVRWHESFRFMNCLFMVIEYMDGGSLTEIIYSHLKKIPEDVIAYVLLQIVLGLHLIHSKNQIHRDLKSDNILVSRSGEIKIADFGFATQLTQEKQRRVSVVGTPSWMAPELILKKEYNEKVDVWSVGIIAIELVLGEPPHLRMLPIKAMYTISSKPPPRLDSRQYSENLCSFVEKCLQKNPDDRVSFASLLDHPLLRSVQPNSAEKFAHLVATKKSAPMSQLMQMHKDN